MKKVLSVFLFFFYFNSFSQDSCVVKIFPGDCLNCYIGMTKIETVDDRIKKTIVFPDLSKAEVTTYLKNVLNISDIGKYTVIVSDSIYNSMNNNLSSEVYVYNKNKLYDHSLLKKFYGIDKRGPYEINIPDSIAISNAATIISNDDYFFITDSKFGNCIFISKHADRDVNILRVRSLTTKSNFNKISGDTACYHIFSRYKKVLKSANMDKMQFKSSFSKRGAMTAFILAPDIKEINGEAGLTYKIGIVIFNNTEKYNILRIDDKSIPENYIVYPGFFSDFKGNYYIQLVNTDRDLDNQYILGKFDLVNRKLVFSGFPGYKIPPEYLPASKFKSLRKILSASNPYVFLQYSLSYYDMDNDQTYQLPFDSVNLKFEFPGQAVNLLKFEYNLQIIDAYTLKKTIQVLYEKSGNYYIAYIDRTNHSLVKKIEIFNPVKELKTGLYFYSSDKLFYLTKDNTIIVEEIKYR